MALLLLSGLTHAANVLDVYRLAQQNDPRYRSAQATYQANLEKLPQARAALLPNVGAQGQIAQNNNRVHTSAPSPVSGSAGFESNSLTLSLTQPIYNSALFVGLRQAHAQVRQAEAQFAASQQDLILRVAQAYIAVLQALDQVDLAAAKKAADSRQLETVQGQLEAGLATITDVNQAKARYENDVAAEIKAQNDLRDALEGLREITGQFIPSVARIKQQTPLIHPDPPDIEKWVKTALTQNLSLAYTQETVQIALEEIKRQRAGHLPTLDIVGSYVDTDNQGSIIGPGVRQQDAQIGLQLNVPLYQGGQITSLTREAAQRYGAAQQDLETQTRAVDRSTRAAYLGVVNGISQVEALRQSVIAGQSTVDAKREGYAAGINTNLDVLDAIRDLFISQVDLLNARYSYILSLLQLKLDAGTLSQDDLVRFNGYLQ